MNTIEISKKLYEVSRRFGYGQDFFALIYYSENKEAIFTEDTYPKEVKDVLIQYLKHALECPRCYPCGRVGKLDIYYAQWVDGTIVLASETPGFIPIKVLDETIKQLGIGIKDEGLPLTI